MPQLSDALRATVRRTLDRRDHNVGAAVKHRILLVEDERDIREVLEESLTDAGYEIVAAANGREAIDRSTGDRPSLIVLDMMMPIMDGLEFLETQATVAHLAGVPVVITTAHPPQVTGARPTVRAVLRKPFAFASLMSLVREICVDAPAGPAVEIEVEVVPEPAAAPAVAVMAAAADEPSSPVAMVAAPPDDPAAK